VAVAQVLHEGMSRGENPDAAVALQPASAAAVAFQPPVICLDRVVRVLLNGVQGRGSQFVEPPRASCGTGQGSEGPGGAAARLGEQGTDVVGVDGGAKRVALV
jgi:hypothetical protein